MLEKLLPSLFKEKTNQNPSPQRRSQPSQPKRNKEDLSLESGFNLVSTPQRLYVIPKYVSKLSLIVRNFIILLSVSFGVMLVLNFVAVTIISFQKVLQEKYVLEIEGFGDVEERARNIDAKTVAYKKFSNERRVILPKLEFVLDNIESDIELKNMDISPDRFSISFSGRTALDFTNLIVRYLEDDMLSEIVIRSASLNKTENQFNVVLEGSFK